MDSSSPQEDNSVPVKSLEFRGQMYNLILKSEDAGTVVYTSNVQPVRSLLPVTYARPLVGVSTISSKVSDAYFISGGCSATSTLDTEDEKLLTGEQTEELDLCLNDAEYFEKIEQFHVYLDKVKKMVRPGCSQEFLNVALNSLSSLAGILSMMSSKPKLSASL